MLRLQVWIPIVGCLSACSIVSSGLGGEGSLGSDTGGSLDTGAADASATRDLGADTSVEDAPEVTSSDAADTIAASDAVDAADAADATDAADARDATDTPDTSPPPFCNDLDIVACYRFENDGFAMQPHDESLYGNHGSTFTGASFVAGVHGSAVSVNAASVIKVPDSASLDVAQLTMEVRFRPTTLPTGTRAGLLDDNGQYGFFILNGGKVRCSVATPIFVSLDSPAVVAVVGKWTHVACIANGGALIMYVDGVAVNYAAAVGNIDGKPTDGLAIGMNSPSGDNFVGDLDDMRIWRRALTPTEVCASSGSPPKCPP